MNIDLQEMDFGSVVRRRGNQGPPDKGGYNMFCTLIDRSLPNVHPYGNLAIRADAKEAINGRHSKLLSCRQRCRVRYLSGRPSRVK